MKDWLDFDEFRLHTDTCTHVCISASWLMLICVPHTHTHTFAFFFDARELVFVAHW